MGEQRVIYVEGIGPVTVAVGQSVSDAIAATGKRPTETAPPPSQTPPQAEAPRSQLDAVKNAGNTVGDLIMGGAKGVGDTATNLGRMVNSITEPIGNKLADFAGLPGHIDSRKQFDAAETEMDPANDAEALGKLIEQFAEFFVPGSKVGTAARGLSGASNLVAKLPKSAGPIRKMATDAAWTGSKIAGDAAGAAGVATMHGEEDPEKEAAWSAGGSLAGQGVSQATKLLSTKLGQQLGPLLAAMAAMGIIGVPTTGLGLGATMGTFGLAKNMAGRAMRKPGGVGKLGWMAEDAGKSLGTGAAALQDQASGAKRRTRE